eukprot:TRINITY_DN2743_c0_g1_i2.p1 TRINITY_DN2743_c0_g1~~TRINITY_DN2743_c0_g1_i2.p1  ORF type:complete len:654 (+),score=134.20 TRINITY_DN2743_c0_g1_i2:384-2345(+)
MTLLPVASPTPGSGRRAGDDVELGAAVPATPPPPAASSTAPAVTTPGRSQPSREVRELREQLRAALVAQRRLELQLATREEESSLLRVLVARLRPLVVPGAAAAAAAASAVDGSPDCGASAAPAAPAQPPSLRAAVLELLEHLEVHDAQRQATNGTALARQVGAEGGPSASLLYPGMGSAHARDGPAFLEEEFMLTQTNGMGHPTLEEKSALHHGDALLRNGSRFGCERLEGVPEEAGGSEEASTPPRDSQSPQQSKLGRGSAFVAGLPPPPASPRATASAVASAVAAAARAPEQGVAWNMRVERSHLLRSNSAPRELPIGPGAAVAATGSSVGQPPSSPSRVASTPALTTTPNGGDARIDTGRRGSQSQKRGSLPQAASGGRQPWRSSTNVSSGSSLGCSGGSIAADAPAGAEATSTRRRRRSASASSAGQRSVSPEVRQPPLSAHGRISARNGAASANGGGRSEAAATAAAVAAAAAAAAAAVGGEVYPSADILDAAPSTGEPRRSARRTPAQPGAGAAAASATSSSSPAAARSSIGLVTASRGSRSERRPQQPPHSPPRSPPKTTPRSRSSSVSRLVVPVRSGAGTPKASGRRSSAAVSTSASASAEGCAAENSCRDEDAGHAPISGVASGFSAASSTKATHDASALEGA